MGVAKYVLGLAVIILALSECEADDVCQLPLASGPCKANIPRWYYDSETESCLQFGYGGCKGNENNFPTKAVCDAMCTEP